jgi:hypothetical protein
MFRQVSGRQRHIPRSAGWACSIAEPPAAAGSLAILASAVSVWLASSAGFDGSADATVLEVSGLDGAAVLLPAPLPGSLVDAIGDADI